MLTGRVMIRKSTLGQRSTVSRLIAALERRELTIFAHIDHAAHARQADLRLPAIDVLVFGNPKAGTGLMAADPRVGLDLPLRMLVWEDEPQQAFVGHHDPRELAGEYDLAEHKETLDRMAELLESVAAEAAGQ
ncbi:CrcB protein [Kutzneria sp. 744]|nr:CrcB protein [Kutzneria sp. 744]